MDLVLYNRIGKRAVISRTMRTEIACPSCWRGDTGWRYPLLYLITRKRWHMSPFIIWINYWFHCHVSDILKVKHWVTMKERRYLSWIACQSIFAVVLDNWITIQDNDLIVGYWSTRSRLVWLINVNLNGVIFCCQAVGRIMREHCHWSFVIRVSGRIWWELHGAFCK